jgi:hypothetical protein
MKRIFNYIYRNAEPVLLGVILGIVVTFCCLAFSAAWMKELRAAKAEIDRRHDHGV